jgi:[protein-PII] uridylyltransferase
MTAAGTKQERRIVTQLVPFMSPRYLLYTSSTEIPSHIKLYQALGHRPYVWHIEPCATSDTRTITICAKDRPGLLSKIAGVLTLNNINILDVRIFTWRNNIALDIFEVEAPPDQLFEQEHWDRAAGHLEAALDGSLDVGRKLKSKQERHRSIRPKTKSRPQHVLVDNESSSFFTIIEVTAWDFPGLLFKITDALFQCRLDIWIAKSAIRIDQVVDVFYVRSFDGEKVDDPEQERHIQATIEAVLV